MNKGGLVFIAVTLLLLHILAWVWIVNNFTPVSFNENIPGDIYTIMMSGS